MRKRVVAAIGGTVTVLFLAVPALADQGVTIGPARQMVEQGEGWATIYVSNPTSNRVRVRTSTWANVNATWRQTTAGLIPQANSFVIEPGEQRTLNVKVMEQSSPCSLVGVGLLTHIGTTENGVAVRGNALAQILVQGRNGSEAACLSTLEDSVPQRHIPVGKPLPYWILFAVAALMCGLWALKRWHDRPKGKAYGF